MLLDSAPEGACARAGAVAAGAWGIAATLAANVTHGMGHGAVAPAVPAWQAVALVGVVRTLHGHPLRPALGDYTGDAFLHAGYRSAAGAGCEGARW